MTYAGIDLRSDDFMRKKEILLSIGLDKSAEVFSCLCNYIIVTIDN